MIIYGWPHALPTIDDMIGQTFVKVYVVPEFSYSYGTNEALVFEREDGVKYIFIHLQDCCESVSIKDICGDLSDLENNPLLIASEEIREGDCDDSSSDSYTWTFYKFATIKGSVDVSWYGCSNGYYSETVHLLKEIPDENTEK